MGLYLGAAFRLRWTGLPVELVERTPEKSTSAEPRTKDVIKAVRLSAFTPPSSPVARHRVIAFPWTMVNVG